MTRRLDPDALLALAVAGSRPVRSPARARLLASAVRPGWEPWIARVSSLWDLPGEQVAAEFRRAGFPREWEPSPFPTVDAFHLEGGPATAGADVGLVRIPDGTVFPMHTHGGVEEYVVLAGVMHFTDGHREYPGDRVRHDETVTHGYTAEGEVIVAIVMRGEIRPV